MNWAEIGTIVSILSTVVGLATWFVRSHVQAGLLGLEVKMRDWRDNDKKEVREWINGSFMRAREVSVRLEAMDKRIDHVEASAAS